MAQIYHNITELIGNTPIVKLNKLVPEGAADVYVKLEAFNPGSSVKDRIALSMIETAEQEGLIQPGATIVGNDRKKGEIMVQSLWTSSS